MSLYLWRLQCSKCLGLGHRRYTLPAVARRELLPTHNAYTDSFFAERSPDDPQQFDEIPVIPGKPAKKLRRPKEETISHRNLLERTKVQEYLDFVASTNDTVTLADIERCRPPEHGDPGTPEYESGYNSLLDTLVRSFSTKQLRQFLHLYQLDPPRKRTKWHYAVSIIEHQWGWPSLTEIQKQQRDWTEVTYASRLFFFVSLRMFTLTFSSKVFLWILDKPFSFSEKVCSCASGIPSSRSALQMARTSSLYL
jgi:hypothetical protein